MDINRASGYVVVAGTVAGTTEGEKGEDTWYCVKLRYEYNGEMKDTDIYFWNDMEADDFRRYQADRAKQKNLHDGSVIVVRCRFRDDSKKEATGYGIYYSGLIRIKPDTEHEKDDRSVLVGTVTSMKNVTVRGQDALKVNVYAGKTRLPDGASIYQHVSVYLTGDQAVMARTDLAERDLGNGMLLRKKVVFRCGAVRTYYIPPECPISCGPMQYDEASGKIVCPDCGAMTEPAVRDKRERVFALDYMVLEDREIRGEK